MRIHVMAQSLPARFKDTLKPVIRALATARTVLSGRNIRSSGTLLTTLSSVPISRPVALRCSNPGPRTGISLINCCHCFDKHSLGQSGEEHDRRNDVKRAGGAAERVPPGKLGFVYIACLRAGCVTVRLLGDSRPSTAQTVWKKPCSCASIFLARHQGAH